LLKCAQIFELFHPSNGTIINLQVVTTITITIIIIRRRRRRRRRSRRRRRRRRNHNNERGLVRIPTCYEMRIRMIWCKMELPKRIRVWSLLLSFS